MKLVEITREEAKNYPQYLVYNPYTENWRVYYGDDKRGIAYDKHAFELLEYYKIEKEEH